MQQQRGAGNAGSSTHTGDLAYFAGSGVFVEGVVGAGGGPCVVGVGGSGLAEGLIGSGVFAASPAGAGVGVGVGVEDFFADFFVDFDLVVVGAGVDCAAIGRTAGRASATARPVMANRFRKRTIGLPPNATAVAADGKRPAGSSGMLETPRLAGAWQLRLSARLLHVRHGDVRTGDVPGYGTPGGVSPDGEKDEQQLQPADALDTVMLPQHRRKGGGDGAAHEVAGHVDGVDA